jgi:hypothetical protein
MNADLVVVAEAWRGLPTAVHHLMTYVALDRQILWVDADVLRRNAAGSGTVAPPLSGGCGEPAPFDVISQLPPLPRAGHLACVADGQHAVRLVAATARRVGIRRPVLWLAAAEGRRLTGLMNEQGVVYHQLADALPDTVDAAALAADADLIVTGSPAAAAVFPAERARVLADGVSPELFATPMQPAPTLPLDRAVAGFHGRIDASFDAALLDAVARRLPHWRFLLIGPLAKDAPPLPQLSNVTVLGPRPHAELPRFSQYWTASMLLRRGAVGDRLPQQLREYVAAGAPIVGHCDGLPQALRPTVWGADGADDFVAGLQAALREPREFRARRRRALDGDVWPARAAEVAAMLDALVPAAEPWAQGRSEARRVSI